MFDILDSIFESMAWPMERIPSYGPFTFCIPSWALLSAV